MTARRRLLAAASATLSLAALTACEKPAPIVTLVSGGHSVYTEAATFCFEDGQKLESGECARRTSSLTRLEVRGGDVVGVDVDKELAERGWQLELQDPNDPQGTQRSPTIQDHYFTFTAPGLQPGGRLLLTVRTVDQQDAATGEWQFELVPES